MRSIFPIKAACNADRVNIGEVLREMNNLQDFEEPISCSLCDALQRLDRDK